MKFCCKQNTAEQNTCFPNASTNRKDAWCARNVALPSNWGAFLSLGATCHIRNECPWSLTPVFQKQLTVQDHAHSRCTGKNHNHSALQAYGRSAKCRKKRSL